jgi:hypothetical protein
LSGGKRKHLDAPTHLAGTVFPMKMNCRVWIDCVFIDFFVLRRLSYSFCFYYFLLFCVAKNWIRKKSNHIFLAKPVGDSSNGTIHAKAHIPWNLIKLLKGRTDYVSDLRQFSVSNVNANKELPIPAKSKYLHCLWNYHYFRIYCLDNNIMNGYRLCVYKHQKRNLFDDNTDCEVLAHTLRIWMRRFKFNWIFETTEPLQMHDGSKTKRTYIGGYLGY